MNNRNVNVIHVRQSIIVLVKSENDDVRNEITDLIRKELELRLLDVIEPHLGDLLHSRNRPPEDIEIYIR